MGREPNKTKRTMRVQCKFDPEQKRDGVKLGRTVLVRPIL